MYTFIVFNSNWCYCSIKPLGIWKFNDDDLIFLTENNIAYLWRQNINSRSRWLVDLLKRKKISRNRVIRRMGQQVNFASLFEGQTTFTKSTLHIIWDGANWQSKATETLHFLASGTIRRHKKHKNYFPRDGKNWVAFPVFFKAESRARMKSGKIRMEIVSIDFFFHSFFARSLCFMLAHRSICKRQRKPLSSLITMLLIRIFVRV